MERELYLYIIIHPKFKGWIKLGRADNLRRRLHNYQTYCPFRAYQMAYHNFLPEYIIKKVENQFKTCIHSNGFEWYKCTVNDAVSKIEKIIAGEELTANKIDLIQFQLPTKAQIYSQRFTYYAFENLDEYSYIEEKSFCSLEDLVKYFNLNPSATNTISALFKNKKSSTVIFKNLIIRRKPFKLSPACSW